MQRTILLCLVVLAVEPIRAQDVFVAPTNWTVVGSTEQSNSDDPAHSLYVSNNSTVPIVVFGVSLTECENVRQSCGPRRTKIKIDAKRRTNVGRVEARDKERGFSYRWTFSYVADSSQQAADEYFPSYAAMMNAIGRERGWAPIQRPDYDALRSLRGALVVGSPGEVVEKILFQHELFGHQRFLAQISVGTLPHAQVMHAIELLGTQVAPQVRAEVARREAEAA